MIHFKPSHWQLKERIEGLVARHIAPLAEEIEAREKFPDPFFRVLAQEGFFRLALPRRYGGLETDTVGLALVIEAISRVCPSAALLVFPTAAVMKCVEMTGTLEQRDRFFSDAARRDVLCGFCLTEPEAGSDAAALKTRAARDGDDYVIKGQKAYITLGQHAQHYLVFVRTGPGRGPTGVSAVLVPRDAEGLSFGRPERKMGLWGSITSAMFLDDVRVPIANRLLGEGEGWRVLTGAANVMRLWGAASMASGIAQGAFRTALEYARTTVVEGRTLLSCQGIGFALADMRMKIEAVRSLIYRVLAMADSGMGSPREIESMVSMGKCLASDTAVEVAGKAVEIMGLDGVRRASGVERLFRDAKAIQIFDGSNQVQRLIIARNMVGADF
ncbi:MAG: acyl-CoA dehydrogenase family protein [Proteobacteria bacterium]|nr:acyl-CoA dehydrogenase family protein [Pseudomonadota bacterium]MBU1742638.1 acyl-CoA dehydrogenase family protein [Pseudomonadota bacterium]